MLPEVIFTENETISDFENQDLAVVGPGDQSGMVFGLTRDRLRRQPCSRGLVLVELNDVSDCAHDGIPSGDLPLQVSSSIMRS